MPALWLPGNPKTDPPPEYGILNLCRMFHCLPDELDRQDAYLMFQFIEFIKIEGEVQKLKSAGKSR